jgi:hypothetical protein
MQQERGERRHALGGILSAVRTEITGTKKTMLGNLAFVRRDGTAREIEVVAHGRAATAVADMFKPGPIRLFGAFGRGKFVAFGPSRPASATTASTKPRAAANPPTSHPATPSASSLKTNGNPAAEAYSAPTTRRKRQRCRQNWLPGLAPAATIEVPGYWRMQPVGPARTGRRRTWVEKYVRSRG